MASSLEEAMKLVNAKQPTKMKNFRRRKKLWEDDEYEKTTSPADNSLTLRAKKTKVTLSPVKWLENGKKED